MRSHDMESSERFHFHVPADINEAQHKNKHSKHQQPGDNTEHDMIAAIKREAEPISEMQKLMLYVHHFDGFNFFIR